jgi:hypothetical protein
MQLPVLSQLAWSLLPCGLLLIAWAVLLTVVIRDGVRRRRQMSLTPSQPLPPFCRDLDRGAEEWETFRRQIQAEGGGIPARRFTAEGCLAEAEEPPAYLPV